MGHQRSLALLPGSRLCRGSRPGRCQWSVAVEDRVDYKARRAGEVAEWLKVAVSKTVVGLNLPWVRIPPSPPGPSSLLYLKLF